MAPRRPPSREEVLALLRAPEGPPPVIELGTPTVQAGIVREGGAWKIRRAELDAAAYDAFVRERRARGELLFPEHCDSFRHPTGAVLLEAPTLEAFCAALLALDPWPLEW